MTNPPSQSDPPPAAPASEHGGAAPAPARRRSWRKALLALGFGVVLALVALEVAGQGYFIVMERTGWKKIKTHDQHFFERSDSKLLGYEMQTGWSKMYRGRWLSVNEHGIRDRYHEVPGDEVMKIALLGDSVVFGNNITQERILSELIEERLDPSRITARVLNFGVSGYCLEQVLEFLRRKNDIYDVDAIVFVLNPNDFTRIGTVTEGGSNGLYRMYNPPAIKGPWLVKKLVYRLMRGPGSRPSARWYRWIFERNGGLWKDQIVELKAYAESHDAELIVVPFPAGSAFEGGAYALADVNAEIVAFLEDRGIEHIDLVPIVAGRAGTFFDDTDHCTAEGNELLADLIHERLVPLKRAWIEESLRR